METRGNIKKEPPRKTISATGEGFYVMIIASGFTIIVSEYAERKLSYVQRRYRSVSDSDTRIANKLSYYISGKAIATDD